jgi:ribosome biogenesis GTPase
LRRIIKDYNVLSDENHQSVRCMLRGKFKKEYELKKDKLYFTDFAAVGDIVEFDLNKDGTGVIHNIRERKNHLSRKKPKVRGASYRGERLEQVIAANIDNVIIVASVHQPEFNNRVLDRLLVSSESSSLNSIIVINKIDLAEDESMNEWQKLYREIGYDTIITCALSGKNIEELKLLLAGKRNLFWGQSGVGKSSILNKLYPNLQLKIGDISSFSSKGIHTTVTASMIFVGDDTFIIDTPGMREIDPYGIQQIDLGHYFIEFEDYLNDCKFNTCTHLHEPGCAVINAVEDELISAERYDSYLRILNTIEDDLNF